MLITFSPQRRDDALTLARAGEVLIINGQAVDLSATPDGGGLDAGNDWIVGPVRRIDGNLHVTVILPHGPNPSRKVRQPDAIIDPPDGVIAVPFDPAPPEPGAAPDPEPADLMAAFEVAIQFHIDMTARSRRYADGNSLAGYVASTVPAWAAEAAAFVAWRDAVWVYAYGEMDKVIAAQRDVPAVDEFIGELPVIEWPE